MPDSGEGSVASFMASFGSNGIQSSLMRSMTDEKEGRQLSAQEKRHQTDGLSDQIAVQQYLYGQQSEHKLFDHVIQFFYMSQLSENNISQAQSAEAAKLTKHFLIYRKQADNNVYCQRPKKGRKQHA